MRSTAGISVAAALVVLGSVACSSAATDGADAPTDASGAFPAEVTDSFGTVTIDSAPQRVVTAGFNDQDFALALGVTPVATRAFTGFDYQARPWAQDQLAGNTIEEIGAEQLDLEAIAAADPDLVMATYAYLEPEQYEQLSALAPTVGDLEPADGAEAASWREQLAAYGTALGRTAEAEQVRDDVDARFDEARTENPQIEGRTAAVVLLLDGSFYILDAGDPRNRFFTDLGFETPATTGTVSPERYDLLDQDNLIVLGATPEDLANDALFQNLDVVTEDRTVYLGEFGTDVPSAVGFASPLSMPFAIDAVTPALARATDDDPATVVGTIDG